MINPTEEQRKAFNDDMEAFFAEIEKKKKQLQEDLKAIKWSSSDGKVCDFGCGSGYTTYCLTSLLHTTESIGVDIDPNVISKANRWFEAVKLYKQLSAKETKSDDVLTQEANQALGILRHPEFLVGDVVSGENLPSDISLAYCRKLLVNIMNYSKDKVRLAIKNMVNRMRPGGWFVAVEEISGGNFNLLLEEGGLCHVDTSHFQLNGAIPCYRYVYRKLDKGS